MTRDDGSFLRAAADRERPADHPGAVGHDAQAHALAAPCRLRDANTIVLHDQANAVVTVPKLDGDVPGLPMLHRVADGFLRDPIEMHGRRGIFDGRGPIAFELAAHLKSFSGT